MMELLPPAPYEAAYTPSGCVIGFAFDAQCGLHAFASDRKTPFQANPNHLSFVPEGCDVYSQSIRGGEYLRIVLDARASEWPHRDRRFTNVVDARSILVAEQLRGQLIWGDEDILLLEHLVGRLSERVTAILTGIADGVNALGWMTPRRLRLSLDLIEEELATKLTVARLAASLGLSTGFFSRAFKEAVGKAPHDFIIDRRIARAREQMGSGVDDLSAIAQEAGFNSHAHMASVFRKRLGVTPTEVRRSFE